MSDEWLVHWDIEMSNIVRKIVYLLLLTALSTGMISTGHARLLDRGFEANYEVHYTGFYIGDSNRALTRQDPDSWTYKSYTEPKGVAAAFVADKVNETSKIRMVNNRFQPEFYDYHQYGGKDKVKFRLDFDWQANKLSNSYKNETFPLEAETHDLLSFQIQLMSDLQAGKKSVSYTIADKKRIDTYHLKLSKTEQIETPLKSFSTIKLISNKIRNKLQFIFWCAPELDYLPVKVLRVDKKGRKSVMLLKSVKFR